MAMVFFVEATVILTPNQTTNSMVIVLKTLWDLLLVQATAATKVVS
jgi:hypothetical protein